MLFELILREICFYENDNIVVPSEGMGGVDGDGGR